MKRTAVLVVLLLAASTLLSACASRVWMLEPAKVDLASFGRIGVVAFDGADEELRRRATREFQESVLQARPGIQLVELEAVEDAGDLAAVFLGSVEFSSAQPTIGVTSSLVEVQARADILGTLAVRLVEPERGATLWMRSSDRKGRVASASVDTAGNGNLGYTDERGVQISMLAAMTEDVTADFRDQYFRRRPEDIPAHYEVTYSDGVEVFVPPAR